MNIRDSVTPEQKKALRKVRTLPDAVKAAVYGGNKRGPELAMQLWKDIKTYGLFEAILYVENYEKQGLFEPDTARKALYAALHPEDEEDQKVEGEPWTAGY